MSLSSVAIAASAKAGKQSEHNADIIEFVEAPWGLKMTLFPVQKVILKAHYGLELDDKERFTITDWRRENARHVTEKEYLKILFEEGRCNIGEVIPGKQRREMILSIGRRSGKCVRGDTLIPTDRGILPIAELGDIHGEEYQPLSVQVVQERGDVRRTQFFYNGGRQPTRAVTTKSGYFIEGTDSHRIKVLNQQGFIVWKYLGDIQVGDMACINRSSNLWAKEYYDIRPHHKDLKGAFPDFLTEKWGELMGILTGDGHWKNRKALRVTTGNLEFKDYCSKLFTELFGKFNYYPDNRCVGVGDVYYFNKPFRVLMERLGWTTDVTPYTKRVPFSIMRSPKAVVASYLRGLLKQTERQEGSRFHYPRVRDRLLMMCRRYC
jgi:hypothetical protein